MSHRCLAVSPCNSFVLCWRKRKAAASKYEWLESSDLNVRAHKHKHDVEIIWPTHTRRRHTVQFSQFGWLCRQHLFCALSSSLCTPPSVTGGGDSDSRSKETHTHTHTKLTETQSQWHMVSVSPTHTHTLVYTHLLWGSATVPYGARQAQRHVACLHHLLSGQTQDEGLKLTAHRRTETNTRTHTVDRCI